MRVTKKKTSDPRLLKRRKVVQRVIIGIVLLGATVYGTVASLALHGLKQPGAKAVSMKELPNLMIRHQREESLNAEEMRAVAQQLDRDFHEQRDERAYRSMSRSRGLTKPYQGWYESVQSLEAQLEISIKEAEGKKVFSEGTVEWELQQELERIREDRPSLSQ